MMLRYITFVLGVYMLCVTGVNTALGSTTVSPHIVKLKNGLTIYALQDDRFPLVSTKLYVRAGSAYETPQIAGLSHLLEHMVFKGTIKRPKGEVARDIEAVGGYLNAGTSFDYTVYLTDVPAKHWALGMDVVKDMAFHPLLDPQELASEKDVVVAELQRGKDNPGSRIFESLQGNTLQGTSYAHPIIGYEQTIRAITVEDIRAYIAKYYQPQNMLLVVVGNIDPKAVLAEAENLFGALQNTSDIPAITALMPLNLGEYGAVHVEKGAWNKVYLGMAFPAPGDKDARSLPLDVLAHLLGGDATSYLYRKYKYEKQLVDHISVGNYTFERVGMLYFTVHLDAAKVDIFWKEFLEDLKTLKAQVFTAQDIARTKLQIEDEVHRSKETLSGLASWKGQLELFHGGEQGGANLLVALHNVDNAQLQQAMDVWLNPQRVSVTVLTPQHAALPDMEAILKTAWPAAVKTITAEKTAAGKDMETIDLGHGRHLVLIPDMTMPYTTVDFYMSGGDSLLPPNAQGLASLAARVLTSGTIKLSAPELEKFLADRAASVSAVAGRQVFGLSLRTPTRFNAELFGLFRDILAEPAFAEVEVAREKKAQVAFIRARDDKPLGLAFAEMPPFLFPQGHPYGYRSTGTIQDVEKYTVAQVRGFWDRQVRQPWVLAVAGDFDREAVTAFARTLPIPQDKTSKLDVPSWGKEKTLKLQLEGRQQGHLMLVFKTVPTTHEDAVGLELLQNILAGQSGLLFRDLRDKQGLGYTVTAFNRMSPKAGYMVFYIGTEPGKIAQAQAGFEKVIADIQHNLLPEAEVQAGKNQMEGDYYRERQRLASRSAEAATLGILDQPLDFRKQRVAMAQNITAQDVQILARKYLNMQDAYVVTVVP